MAGRQIPVNVSAPRVNEEERVVELWGVIPDFRSLFSIFDLASARSMGPIHNNTRYLMKVILGAGESYLVSMCAERFSAP